MAAAAVATDAGQTGGKRPEPPSIERLAAAFPQLEVIELIGQGGMGAVYKARQRQLDRVVALKVLPPGVGGDAAFAERFTREAKALAKLLHPNIVALFEFGQADGIYYLLMEYVDGVSLGQLLRSSRVSPREALAIVPQICDALQYAHDQGIVHRDIKPENILLDRRGRVKVADFGLAKLVEANAPLTPSLSPSEGERVAGRPGEGKTPVLTDAGKVMGTPAYMAPEQVEHPGEVDHRADIYALGVVFYQMLTGELPGKRLEPPSRKVLIDVRLDEVVMRALERDPGRRYAQASVLKTQVETIAATPSAQGSAGSAPPNSGQTQPASQAGAPPHQAGASADAAQPDLWRRLKYRFWPPLVGHRNGQRVINWPAVAMRGMRGLLLVLLPSIVAGIFLGALSEPSRGIGFSLGIFAVGSILVCFVLGIRVLRGFALPSVLVPEFESFAGQPMAGRSATRDPSRGRGDASQTEEPKSESLLTSSLTGHRPRFSRTAIVGVCFGILGISALVLYAVIGDSNLLDEGPSNALAALGALCLLTSTILGCVAVSQIRRSEGELHGMWLAVFDGLLFPLLLLDGAIAAFILNLGLALSLLWRNNDAPLNSLSIVLACILLAAVDYLIIRRVWPAVNQSGTASTQSVQKSQRLWPLVVIVFVVIPMLCLLGDLAVVHYLRELRQARALHLQHTGTNSTSAFGPELERGIEAARILGLNSIHNFGPVIERVLVDSKSAFESEAERTNALIMIDFGSGALLAGPAAMWAADTSAQQAWMQTNGVDALAVIPGVNGLVGLDMKAVSVPVEAWNDLSAVSVAEQLAQTNSKNTILLGPGKSLPPTWLFQTRKGSAGILQITGFTENPGGVKLRYKLVLPRSDGRK